MQTAVIDEKGALLHRSSVASAQEEVSFMASIASCMGPAAARQPPRTQPVQEPSPKLLQDLMLVCHHVPPLQCLHFFDVARP